MSTYTSTFKPLSELEKAVLSECKRFPVTITKEGVIRFAYPDLPPLISEHRPGNAGNALVRLREAGHVIQTQTDEGDWLYYAPDPELVAVFGPRKPGRRAVT